MSRQSWIMCNGATIQVGAAGPWVGGDQKLQVPVSTFIPSVQILPSRDFRIHLWVAGLLRPVVSAESNCQNTSAYVSPLMIPHLHH